MFSLDSIKEAIKYSYNCTYWWYNDSLLTIQIDERYCQYWMSDVKLTLSTQGQRKSIFQDRVDMSRCSLSEQLFVWTVQHSFILFIRVILTYYYKTPNNWPVYYKIP